MIFVVIEFPVSSDDPCVSVIGSSAVTGVTEALPRRTWQNDMESPERSRTLLLSVRNKSTLI